MVDYFHISHTIQEIERTIQEILSKKLKGQKYGVVGFAVLLKYGNHIFYYYFQAQTSVELSVRPKETLYQDPLHPEGLDRIQELEQPKDFSLPEVPDRECDNPPKFLGNLQDMEYPVRIWNI